MTRNGSLQLVHPPEPEPCVGLTYIVQGIEFGMFWVMPWWVDWFEFYVEAE